MTLKCCLAAAGLVLVLSFGTVQAARLECPAKSTQMDDIIASLNAAQGCDAAMEVFKVCQYGASGDVQFGEVVEKKCGADFLGGADAARKRAYKRELGVCGRKYRNQSRTIYISFTAFCRAEVAQRYSQRMRKAAKAR